MYIEPIILFFVSTLGYIIMLSFEKKGDVFNNWREKMSKKEYLARRKLFKTSKETMLYAAVFSLILLIINIISG